MYLTDEQFDKHRKNLLLYGTSFIKVILINGDLQFDVLDNEAIKLEPSKNADSRQSSK